MNNNMDNNVDSIIAKYTNIKDSYDENDLYTQLYNNYKKKYEKIDYPVKIYDQIKFDGDTLENDHYDDLRDQNEKKEISHKGYGLKTKGLNPNKLYINLSDEEYISVPDKLTVMDSKSEYEYLPLPQYSVDIHESSDNTESIDYSHTESFDDLNSTSDDIINIESDEGYYSDILPEYTKTPEENSIFSLLGLQLPDNYSDVITDKENEQCCICMVNKRSIVLIDCHHSYTCYKCITNILNSNKKACPICTKVITKMPIFFYF